MKKILAILFSLLLICALLAGCGSLSKDAASNSSYYDSTATAEEGWYDEESTAETPAESAGAIGSAPTGEHDPAEKIIYTANARVETTEFDDALQTAYSLIETAGGYIQSSYISGNSYNQIYRYGASYKSADLVIRVPSENFKSLTDSFSAVGNVLYVEYAQDNITTQYYNVQTRLDAYNAEHDRLIEMMQQADNVSDMILVEERLSEVEYQIDALSTSLRGMQKDVDYSTVTLEIQEVEKYTEPEEIHLTYWQRAGRGFMSTLKGIGTFFQELLQVIISALPVLVILAVIALVIILLVRHNRRRKRPTSEKPPVQTPDQPQDKQ